MRDLYDPLMVRHSCCWDGAWSQITFHRVSLCNRVWWWIWMLMVMVVSVLGDCWLVKLSGPDVSWIQSPWPQWTSMSIQCRPGHIHMGCCIHLGSSAACCPSQNKGSWQSWKAVQCFLMLCLDSILLIWMKVIWTAGRSLIIVSH